jgi:lipoprotein-anchoring transpeptidase ErfK/SrfK
MSGDSIPYKHAFQEAQDAMHKGNKHAARYWAQRVVALGPDREDGWLLLAANSSPRASIAYLKRALEINPQSRRARQGMHWAIQNMRSASKQEGLKPVAHRPIISYPIPSEAIVRQRPSYLSVALVITLFIAVIIAWFGSPSFTLAINTNHTLSIAALQLPKETRTPTPTATFTPTPTFTPSPTVTITPSPVPTDTPTTVPTDTPQPTKKPKQPKNKAPSGQYKYPGRPGVVGESEHWVDVDLSLQRVYAYEGDQLVRSFLVSTGTWLHPTIKGTYRIYVKYRYADMSGPGYYLPNVPYVMYFYKGYGLHGTYWHHNFGTPMSHGCVNLTIGDSAWMFGFASVGTVVNVHQ